MTKEQQLIKSLEDAEMPFSDWYEEVDTNLLNDTLEKLTYLISFSWSQQGSDSYLEGSYYSDKINKRIIIDEDFYRSFESLEDMVNAIVEVEKEAQQIEDKL